MSRYENIIPGDITANKFDYHNAPIELECDGTYYAAYPTWCFFNQNQFSATVNTYPPHFVGIKSSSPLVIDRFDFTAVWDLVYMTCKDYRIETSMDGEIWNTVYSGMVPGTSLYTEECEFEPIICKQIRLTVLSTYDQRGYKWFQGGHIKIYGTLANVGNLYTNTDAYGIRRLI